MGFIKAFADSVGGTFSDQWKDFYGPKSNVSATAAVFRAVPKSTNNDRGSNTSGSDNIITNGSKIVVPEGTALITMQDGGITGFISEAGSYIYSSDDVNSKSIFNKGEFLASTISQSIERFKFGGQPGSEQLAFYVNLKEIPNNKFGTQSEIYWDDAYLGTQAGALTRGTYTLKIVDPVLFVKQFVPVKYLVANSDDFDFADMNNDAGAQLFNEVVSSLSGAFSNYTNDPNKGNRISKIQGDQIGFAQSLSNVVEESYQWKSARGLEIAKVAIQSIEYDAVTKALITDVQKADALSGARGNSYMQQSVARGIEAAGSTSGGTGMAFMGMGANMAGGMMNNFNQPVSQNSYEQSMNQATPAMQQATPAMQQATPAMQQATPAMQQAVTQEQTDPYAKLTEMKKLLDAGVISEEDFNKVKSQVLGI